MDLQIGCLFREWCWVPVAQGDADERGGAFNGRPYFRLLLGLIVELSPSDPSDNAGVGYLIAISAALHALQPLRVPGFAFAWLELVSHRQLMPKLLLSPQPKVRT
jgi:CCR4-NOT transcription complex subunit 1